jgi:hypothetical protein
MKTNLAVPLTRRIPVRGVPPRLLWYHGDNSWGKNPYAQPLYRVIWSETHFYLLGGSWPDGAIEYRWAPYYAGRKEWVLEKWLSPEQFAGSRFDWENSQMDGFLDAHGMTVYTMGPYPAHGWYEHCYSFPSDSEPNLGAIVPLIEQTKNLTLAQIKAGIQLYHERQRKEWGQKVEDGIHEAMPAFGNSPTNLNPRKPTGDTPGLLQPGALRKAVAKHRELDSAENVIFEQLPQRGFSMPQRKIISTEE